MFSWSVVNICFSVKENALSFLIWLLVYEFIENSFGLSCNKKYGPTFKPFCPKTVKKEVRKRIVEKNFIIAF